MTHAILNPSGRGALSFWRGSGKINLCTLITKKASFSCHIEKNVLKVPDTDIQILDNTRPFLRSSIMSFGITLAFSKECYIAFLGNTGTPEMSQYSPILGRSSIWDPKYTFYILSFICLQQVLYFTFTVDHGSGAAGGKARTKGGAKLSLTEKKSWTNHLPLL